MYNLGAPDFRKVGLATYSLVRLILGMYNPRNWAFWACPICPVIPHLAQSWRKWSKWPKWAMNRRKIANLLKYGDGSSIFGSFPSQDGKLALGIHRSIRSDIWASKYSQKCKKQVRNREPRKKIFKNEPNFQTRSGFLIFYQFNPWTWDKTWYWGCLIDFQPLRGQKRPTITKNMNFLVKMGIWMRHVLSIWGATGT